MNIDMKYWAEGASVPGSWTTVDVLQCFPREDYVSYDSEVLLDGVNYAWTRKYILITIVLKPLMMNDATLRTTANAILKADYFRVTDTRFAPLVDNTTANGVTFVKSGKPEITRQGATLLSTTATLNLISQSVQT